MCTDKKFRHAKNGWSSYRGCSDNDIILIWEGDGLQCCNCGAIREDGIWISEQAYRTKHGLLRELVVGIKH